MQMKDFTILIYNDNQEYLSACLDNIARQIYDLSSVEVIIGTLPPSADVCPGDHNVSDLY